MPTRWLRPSKRSWATRPPSIARPAPIARAPLKIVNKVNRKASRDSKAHKASVLVVVVSPAGADSLVAAVSLAVVASPVAAVSPAEAAAIAVVVEAVAATAVVALPSNELLPDAVASG